MGCGNSNQVAKLPKQREQNANSTQTIRARLEAAEAARKQAEEEKESAYRALGAAQDIARRKEQEVAAALNAKRRAETIAQEERARAESYRMALANSGNHFTGFDPLGAPNTHGIAPPAAAGYQPPLAPQPLGDLPLYVVGTPVQEAYVPPSTIRPVTNVRPKLPERKPTCAGPSAFFKDTNSRLLKGSVIMDRIAKEEESGCFYGV